MRWITASQLEAWGRTLGARVDLPKIVSDLIRASAADIASIRFPSRDKGQVRGFDGHLESETSALNVPLGSSYWEFGAGVGYQAKALRDLEKRTHETSLAVRAVTSFVFVSSWTWDSSDPKNKLEDFVAARNAEGNWKKVHYVDGVSLEHWLEQSPAVAAWHARNTLKVYPLSGVRSIDDFWAEFKARFVPPLTEEVILCSRDKAATQLVADLSAATSIQRLVADTPDEALAFAVAAISKAPPAVRLFLEARTLVIDTAEAGRQLPINRGLVLLLRGEAGPSRPTADRKASSDGPAEQQMAQWQPRVEPTRAGDVQPSALRGFVVTPGFILAVAPIFRDWTSSARAGWDELDRAAFHVRSALGILPQAWGQARVVLGQEEAITALAAICARHAAGKVRSPSGLLRRIVELHESGGLRLDRTLFGLADKVRKEADAASANRPSRA